MPNSQTLHGKNSRLYIGLATGQASPIAKVTNPNGTAMSDWNINAGLDFEEDTAQGDGNKTYIPGLADAGGDLTFFWQDYNTTAGAQQFALVDGALAGSQFKFYAYHGLGAGVTNVYFYGLTYLSLKSLPGGVKKLVEASFDMKPAGPWPFQHP